MTDSLTDMGPTIAGDNPPKRHDIPGPVLRDNKV